MYFSHVNLLSIFSKIRKYDMQIYYATVSRRSTNFRVLISIGVMQTIGGSLGNKYEGTLVMEPLSIVFAESVSKKFWEGFLLIGGP